MGHSTPIRSLGSSKFRWSICTAIVVAIASFVYSQEAELLNIQPAAIKHGEVIVYGIIREIPDYPFGDGQLLVVQVTASDSDLTTEHRREAGGAPCVFCTTMHYFLVREANEKTPKALYRTAPGPVTYLHIDKKEYMLGSVDLGWEGESPFLKRATLLQTGFAPPLFKRRIDVYFEEPVEFVSKAKEIANMAMRDAFSYGRPITLRKVFPPEEIPEVASESD